MTLPNVDWVSVSWTNAPPTVVSTVSRLFAPPDWSQRQLAVGAGEDRAARPDAELQRGVGGRGAEGERERAGEEDGFHGGGAPVRMSPYRGIFYHALMTNAREFIPALAFRRGILAR